MRFNQRFPNAIPLTLPAGDDADDFHAVSGGERALRPFLTAEGEPVVLDEQGGRGKGEFRDDTRAQFTSLISYAHDLDFYSAWPRLM